MIVFGISFSLFSFVFMNFLVIFIFVIVFYMFNYLLLHLNTGFNSFDEEYIIGLSLYFFILCPLFVKTNFFGNFYYSLVWSLYYLFRSVILANLFIISSWVCVNCIIARYYRWQERFYFLLVLNRSYYFNICHQYNCAILEFAKSDQRLYKLVYNDLFSKIFIMRIKPVVPFSSDLYIRLYLNSSK